MNDFNTQNIKPSLKLSTYEELRDQGLSESQAVKLVNQFKSLEEKSNEGVLCL